MLLVGAQQSQHSAAVYLVTWLVVSLVVLSCVPMGQAAKPRPHRELPYFPWQEGLPSGRNDFGMVTAADGSVWLFSGSGSADQNYHDLFKLDPHERTWHDMKTSGPWPSARRRHSMIALNGTRALVFGGSAFNTLSSELWSLDMATVTWTLLVGSGAPGPRPSARIWHSMVTLNSTHVLVFGGYSCPDYAVECNSHQLDRGLVVSDELWLLDVPSRQWTLMDSADLGEPRPLMDSADLGEPRLRPIARYGHSMVALSSNRVLVFGGMSRSSDSLDDLWELHVPTANWTRLGEPGERPSARWDHSMVALHSSRVLVFGGSCQDSSCYPSSSCGCNDLWELHVPTANWTLLQRWSQSVGPNRPSAQSGHRMVALSSTRVLMFGGVGNGIRCPRLIGGIPTFCHTNDLWSLDLPAGDRSVYWTLLNLVNVTAEELLAKFNTIQVCASLKKCGTVLHKLMSHCVCRSTPGRRWAPRHLQRFTTVTLSLSIQKCTGTGTQRSSSVRSLGSRAR